MSKVDELLTQLDSENILEQREAAKALGNYFDERICPRLERLMDASDEILRNNARASIMKITRGQNKTNMVGCMVLGVIIFILIIFILMALGWMSEVGPGYLVAGIPVVAIFAGLIGLLMRNSSRKGEPEAPRPKFTDEEKD